MQMNKSRPRHQNYRNNINNHGGDQNKSYNHVIQDPQDYMFTQKNILLFTKLSTFEKGGAKDAFLKGGAKDAFVAKHGVKNGAFEKGGFKKKVVLSKDENIYRPKQKDSLFWCFYILKHGISDYEMNIGNQHFVVEKREKINYVQLLRNQPQKDMLKLHKIKPMSEVEFDLTNNEKISVKTFFALCVMENINVLLIDKRKKYELQMNDGPIYVIHRNTEALEHHIEFNVSQEKLKDYRENYYSMETFESKLKCMSSYKVAELMELCRKLNIETEIKTNDKKKMTKKDIYEIITLHLS